MSATVLVPSSSVPRETPKQDGHINRRVFIGPLPDKVIIQHEIRRSRTGFENLLNEAIKRNAYNLYLMKGGKHEDWHESDEQSIVDEMVTRWQETEWGRFWRRRKESQDSHNQLTRWVGGTFEVGTVLEGVNLMEDTPKNISEQSLAHVSHSVNTDTFVTARSEFGPGPSSNISASPFDSPHPQADGISVLRTGKQDTNNSPNSSTALLRPSLGPRDDVPPSKARTEVFRRPIIKMPSSFGAKSDSHMTSRRRDKGKGKSVHYAELHDITRREPLPASPGDVLRRTGSAMEETSAGAAAEAMIQNDTPNNLPEVLLMSDRMLVRVSYTKYEVGPTFDEVENRTTSHLSFEAFTEFMVVCRNNRVELYEDYKLPGKAWLTGHQHLAFLIPLEPPTRLSLYSFVDMTFCLTCQPTSTSTASASKSIWPFHRSKEGSNVFIFKIKSRSRAVDWIWQLWRRLGGQIPPTLEIRNPALDTQVRVQVPALESGSIEAMRMFSRQNIIELVRNSLRSVNHWNYLVERQLQLGKTLELAWREGTTIDWVWLEEDVNGKDREWVVLSGLAFQQSSRTSRLEIRLAEHTTHSIRLPNGEKLNEPPAIEGYVDRIKPNTSTRQKIYLTTHDGNIFLLTPARAHPPAPPGLQAIGQSLRQGEVVRGTMQIMQANGVCDLRSIIAVRRAFQPVVPHTHSEVNSGPSKDDNWVNVWSQEEADGSDVEDEGGDESLSKAEDKGRLRMKRSFELLLKDGHVVRFEAYSRRSAMEWIQNLRALIFYWGHRHRLDAREEMDISQASRDPITPRVRVHHHDREQPPEAPADENDPMPNLSSVYSWCVLDGCRPIVRGGKLFLRRGLYGQYKLAQLFLVGGHLVWFRITPKLSLHQAARKKISLTDAYVGSGYFAAMILPKGQYKPDNNLPRRYQDGLEADDPEEDTIFAIWYYSQKGGTAFTAAEDGGELGRSGKYGVRPLNKKRKVAVFRTRSKIERNMWCWAISSEIEKLVRVERERESKMRDVGTVVKS